VLAGRRAPLGAALLFCIACAVAGGATTKPLQRAPLRAADFSRVIAPFPVLDERGSPYTHAFLGGLNVPRPQFVDIDADGDLDLFVHEQASVLWFFENTGTKQQPRFEWRTDRFHDLDIGEWNRIVDIDADGDLDILGEWRYSYVRLFRNVGSARRAEFRSEPDSLEDAEGTPIFADRQNIPALVDLDCNGRLDLFLGRVDGTVGRYEAVSPGAHRFAFVTERFEGIEIIGQIDTVGTRHGANNMAFADADRDGDLDLYWGDFFERGVLYIENLSSACAAPTLRTEPRPVPTADSLNTSGFNVPALPDLDGDGDLDFAMGVLGGAFNPIRTAADNFYYWERGAEGRLTLRTTRFLNGIDVGAESAPAFADLDGDGDQDMLLGSKIDPVKASTSRLVLFRNEGTSTSPSFRLADTLDLVTAYHHAPALGDLDADGDADLLLGTWNHGVLFFRNQGTSQAARFMQDSAVTLPGVTGSNAMPALADIDGDGDMDVFVGEASGELNFLRNEGTAQAPRFVLVSEKLSDIDVGRRSAPALVDLDGDGLLDLVLGREDAGTAAYRNAGTRQEPRFEPYAFDVPLPPLAAPVFVDIDGDGAAELIAGGTGGGLVFFRRAAAPR
jgi:hypothetical protein